MGSDEQREVSQEKEEKVVVDEGEDNEVRRESEREGRRDGDRNREPRRGNERDRRDNRYRDTRREDRNGRDGSDRRERDTERSRESGRDEVRRDRTDRGRGERSEIKHENDIKHEDDIKREDFDNECIKQEGATEKKKHVEESTERKKNVERGDDRRERDRREREREREPLRDRPRDFRDRERGGRDDRYRERERGDRYRDREGDRQLRDRRPRDNRRRDSRDAPRRQERRPSPAGDRRRRRTSSDRPRRRDREERDRERGREREERRKVDEKKRQEEELTPEEKMARAIERDKRTVFVSHLHPKVEDVELFEFFSKAGKVRDVRFITDKSGRSKGLGYVEFYDPSAVAGAINLQGMLVRDHPIQVKLSEAEKNAAAAAMPVGFVNIPRTNLKLFVGNLHRKIRAADVKEIFQIFKFGDIEKVDMPKPDEHWCYVKYRSADDSKKAMLQMSQMDVLGNKLQIGLVTETETQQSAQSGIGAMDQDKLLSTDERIALTAKLSNITISSPATKVQPPPGAIPGMVAVDAPPLDISMLQAGMAPPSRQQSEDVTCLVLSKLFDPSEEEEEDFDEDIEDEFLEHCSKLGTVQHIFVDKFSKEGELWIRFVDSVGCLACYQKMNNRWYNKRQIKATVIDVEKYTSRFPESSKPPP